MATNFTSPHFKKLPLPLASHKVRFMALILIFIVAIFIRFASLLSKFFHYCKNYFKKRSKIKALDEFWNKSVFSPGYLLQEFSNKGNSFREVLKAHLQSSISLKTPRDQMAQRLEKLFYHFIRLKRYDLLLDLVQVSKEISSQHLLQGTSFELLSHRFQRNFLFMLVLRDILDNTSQFLASTAGTSLSLKKKNSLLSWEQHSPLRDFLQSEYAVEVLSNFSLQAFSSWGHEIQSYMFLQCSSTQLSLYEKFSLAYSVHDSKRDLILKLRKSKLFDIISSQDLSQALGFIFDQNLQGHRFVHHPPLIYFVTRNLLEKDLLQELILNLEEQATQCVQCDSPELLSHNEKKSLERPLNIPIHIYFHSESYTLKNLLAEMNFSLNFQTHEQRASYTERMQVCEHIHGALFKSDRPTVIRCLERTDNAFQTPLKQARQTGFVFGSAKASIGKDNYHQCANNSRHFSPAYQPLLSFEQRESQQGSSSTQHHFFSCSLHSCEQHSCEQHSCEQGIVFLTTPELKVNQNSDHTKSEKSSKNAMSSGHLSLSQFSCQVLALSSPSHLAEQNHLTHPPEPASSPKSPLPIQTLCSSLKTPQGKATFSAVVKAASSSKSAHRPSPRTPLLPSNENKRKSMKKTVS